MEHKVVEKSLEQVSFPGMFSGYACTFNTVDEHNEKILPGAFTNSLQKRSIKLLWQHKSEFPIGNVISVEENAYGLFVVAKLLLELDKAKEVYSMIKNGIVDSLSIGYRIVKSKLSQDNIRTLLQLDLLEISPVVFPANSDARILNIKKSCDKEIQDTIKLIRRASDNLKSMS